MRQSIIHIFVPLLVGLAVYILFRQPQTLLHHWLEIQKNLAPLPDSGFTRFFLFYFPDMCWAYSLCSALLLWAGLSKAAGATLSITAVSVYEFRQAAWTVTRLDLADCILMSLAILIAVSIVKK